MELTTPLGRCLLIMVAGWGVGHITHPFATGLRPGSRQCTRVQLPQGRTVASGDWLATFELGSTVVMIIEPRADLTPSISAGDKLCYGQSLFQQERQQ